MRPHTILVVDDDPMFRRSLATRLSIDHHDMLFAETGRQGLAILKETVVDMILLDIMLPDMDGFQFIQTLRRDHQVVYIPVIMITALSDQQTLIRSFESGADDFVNKWVTSGELRARISSLLRSCMRQKETKNISDFRQDLLHMIVHDMCKPVQVIEGYSSLLAGEKVSMGDGAHAINAIHSQSRRLRGYLEEILATARLQAGEITLNQEWTNLCALMQEAIDDHEILLNEKNISIEMVNHKPFHDNVDVRLIRRVFDNLIDNAIKYSPQKSHISVSFNHHPQSDDIISVNIADEGPGIADDAKPILFTKFGIIPSAVPGIRQIGLGLAFCRLVVEAHGGTVSVHDNTPKGATFSVELRNPRRADQQSPSMVS